MLNKKAMGIREVIYWLIGIVIFTTILYGIYQAWDPFGDQISICPGECRDSCGPQEIRASSQCKLSDGSIVPNQVCCVNATNFRPGGRPVDTQDPPIIQIRKEDNEVVRHNQRQTLQVPNNYTYELWVDNIREFNLSIRMTDSNGRIASNNMSWNYTESIKTDENEEIFNNTFRLSQEEVGSYTLTVIVSVEEEILTSVIIPFTVIPPDEEPPEVTDETTIEPVTPPPPPQIVTPASADFKLYGRTIHLSKEAVNTIPVDLVKLKQDSEFLSSVFLEVSNIKGSNVKQCGYHFWKLNEAGSPQNLLGSDISGCSNLMLLPIRINYDVENFIRDAEYELIFRLFGEETTSQLATYRVVLQTRDSSFESPRLYTLFGIDDYEDLLDFQSFPAEIPVSSDEEVVLTLAVKYTGSHEELTCSYSIQNQEGQEVWGDTSSCSSELSLSDFITLRSDDIGRYQLITILREDATIVDEQRRYFNVITDPPYLTFRVNSVDYEMNNQRTKTVTASLNPPFDNHVDISFVIENDYYTAKCSGSLTGPGVDTTISYKDCKDLNPLSIPGAEPGQTFTLNVGLYNQLGSSVQDNYRLYIDII